jgi:NAD(P)-dependent dehydrogenase (short-subunit alcohol dehydrogenase family)
MIEHGPLAGEIALVTGGSRGVGLATARSLLTAGATVALLARRNGPLSQAVAMLAEGGGTVIGIPADVTDPAAMSAAVKEAVAKLGGLSILVNNAGLGRYGSIPDQSPTEWRQVIETNLFGVFYATRAALPVIRERGRGHIVAISSGAAKQGYPNMSAYCAAKAGLEGFMRALAAEVAPEPIRCTTIVPGSILTDFGVRTRADRMASGAKFLEPDDVADAILYVLTQPDRAWTEEMNLWPR